MTLSASTLLLIHITFNHSSVQAERCNCFCDRDFFFERGRVVGVEAGHGSEFMLTSVRRFRKE